MMLQTGSCHCFSFSLFLLFTLHPSPTVAYFLKDCTVLGSDLSDATAGVKVNCDAFDLVRIPDDIPRYIVSLKISGNIQTIHKTDFYHLPNLTDLYIMSSVLSHVDDGAFVPLVQLKELYMDNNRLTTLTDNMFQGLSNLLILKLFSNNIQFLNPAAFQSLTSLQELSLASTSNQITDIITILLPHLQVLNIGTDELESFQSKDLPLNMSSELRELRVMSQSIKKFSITTAAFPHLKTIDLTFCCNDNGWDWDIPDTYFLKNITKLHLIVSIASFNSTRKALQSLDSLEYLELRLEGVWIDRADLLNIVCNISTLRTLIVRGGINANLSKTLSPCTQLTNLVLYDNKLTVTELSKDSIKQMKQLSHLNLGLNKLSKVPEDVGYLYMLQILNLRMNIIRDLSCSDFLNLTRLTHLHLDDNHIYELKLCAFQQLNDLKVLTLNHNSIETFGNIFKTALQKLESLDVKSNRIQQLSQGQFMSLKSLKHLDIGFDGTIGWNPSDIYNNYLEGLDELQTLSLNVNNNIFKMTSSTPNELQWKNYNTTLLNSMKSLTIRFSGQGSLPYAWYMLSDMKALEHLNMYAVYLPQDPDSYKYASQLKSLSLINCNLKSLDFLAKANLTRVSWLDLSHNELTVINVSVFSFLPALRFINMDDNPLACDCSNADFLQWMQNNNQTLVVDTYQYTCGFPRDKKGTRFLDFDYHSCWVDASFICYISSTCVIVLTLLTSFTYHFLRLHLFYAYYLFLAFLYDAMERKRGSPQRYDAFISYNVHDEPWVYREMLPVLEGEQGWRLCLHHRDFLPGTPIIENITNAIYGSRKIICVISRHYLESEWCSREIQMASYRLFDEQKDVLILVFLEDIPAHQLSPYYHMKRLVKRHTYLSWSHAGQHPGLFWQNLRRALHTPHADLGLNEQGQSRVENSRSTSV